VNKQGFTLLEVSLFFAVSGLLALVAFSGLAPRLRNVRFTDAVRSLESSTQRQLSAFQSGVNLREGDINCSQSGNTISINTGVGGQEAGRAEDCIINGRLVVFEESRAVFYPIVSLRKQQNPCIDNELYGKMFCHKPHIVNIPTTTQTIEYRNGAERIAPSTGLRVLYIQDPEGTRTQLMQYTNVAFAGSAVEIDLASHVQLINSDNPAGMCLGLGGRVAEINYTSNDLRPTVNFEGCNL
jgi:type II secretory pathway pseudopilin PulG